MVATKCKTILIAVSNSGLENAIQSIVLIKAMQEHNLIPILASEGETYHFLIKEFPYIKILQLPSYAIQVNTKTSRLSWNSLHTIPALLLAIRNEKKLLKKWIEKYELEGILSDGRLGLSNRKIPSVYIDRQLNLSLKYPKSIVMDFFYSKIKKFDECWLQTDSANHTENNTAANAPLFGLKLKYLAKISRMHYRDLPIKNKLLIVVSGSEPQRVAMQQKLQSDLEHFSGKVIFIKGVFEKNQEKVTANNITYYNYLTTKQLETALNESEIILCRPEDSILLDLKELSKKAFFIPEYNHDLQLKIASKLQNSLQAPYALLENFKTDCLNEIPKYQGLTKTSVTVDWEGLFSLFRSE